MNAGIQAVNRQPRYDLVMKPPTIGPEKGPIMSVAEKQAIATPRVYTSELASKVYQTYRSQHTLLSNISANTAPVTARGQEPKKPEKNLDITSV